MTLYAPTDSQSISLPKGCGSTHSRPDPDLPWALDCLLCETAMPLAFGWASDPTAVKLTPDEIAAAEREKEQAQRLGARNLVDQLMAATGRGPGVSPGSLIEQIARMSPEEKAALRVLLGGPGPEPAAEPDEAAAPAVEAPAVEAIAEPAKKATPTKRAPKAATAVAE